MAASVPDINTDSRAERFTISLAVVAGRHLASVPEPVLHPCPPTVEPLSDPLPDAVEPGFHGVRTRWIRGFMAFRLAQRIRRAFQIPVASYGPVLVVITAVIAREPFVPTVGIFLSRVYPTE